MLNLHVKILTRFVARFSRSSGATTSPSAMAKLHFSSKRSSSNFSYEPNGRITLAIYRNFSRRSPKGFAGEGDGEEEVEEEVEEEEEEEEGGGSVVEVTRLVARVSMGDS
jgi:hypothetical protein